MPNINIEVKIPSVPNFIIVNDNPLSISEFSEKELRNIGKDWTKLLIEKAKSKKKLSTNLTS